MNDASDPSLPPPTIRPPVVRPRDAASLILLRGQGAATEVLVGRRPLSARFMPGVYVFPGGAIEPRDGKAWDLESGAETLAPRLLRSARAAIRETWEEVGVLLGRPAGAVGPQPGAKAAPVEEAYRERGLVAALDCLAYVGRAITPSHSNRRFNTRFFLAAGNHAIGEPEASPELEDAGWHRIDQNMLDGFRDVTRFMLERAISMRSGRVASGPPLFYWAKNARRIGRCREGS
ncbi:MAG: NUDIX domain-containing protein [Stellaceae bacterium]